MSFHRPYRMLHYRSRVVAHEFAFIRWTLNAVAILIVSAAILMGTVIASTMIQHWG